MLEEPVEPIPPMIDPIYPLLVLLLVGTQKKEEPRLFDVVPPIKEDNKLVDPRPLLFSL